MKTGQKIQIRRERIADKSAIVFLFSISIFITVIGILSQHWIWSLVMGILATTLFIYAVGLVKKETYWETVEVKKWKKEK